jgi:hypothetical protein
MDASKTDELIRKMFIARGATLIAGAALLGIVILLVLPIPWDRFLGEWSYLVLITLIYGLLIVIFAGSIVTWRYLYPIAFREGGLKYAVGHLLICIALSPIALFGIIFIPLLVYYDIDRWRQNTNT